MIFGENVEVQRIKSLADRETKYILNKWSQTKHKFSFRYSENLCDDINNKWGFNGLLANKCNWVVRKSGTGTCS